MTDEARAGEPRRAILEAKLGIALGLWPAPIDVGRDRQGFIEYLADFVEREAAAAPAAPEAPDEWGTPCRHCPVPEMHEPPVSESAPPVAPLGETGVAE